MENSRNSHGYESLQCIETYQEFSTFKVISNLYLDQAIIQSVTPAMSHIPMTDLQPPARTVYQSIRASLILRNYSTIWRACQASEIKIKHHREPTQPLTPLRRHKGRSLASNDQNVLSSTLLLIILASGDIPIHFCIWYAYWSCYQ